MDIEPQSIAYLLTAKDRLHLALRCFSRLTLPVLVYAFIVFLLLNAHNFHWAMLVTGNFPSLLALALMMVMLGPVWASFFPRGMFQKGPISCTCGIGPDGYSFGVKGVKFLLPWRYVFRVRTTKRFLLVTCKYGVFGIPGRYFDDGGARWQQQIIDCIAKAKETQDGPVAVADKDQLMRFTGRLDKQEVRRLAFSDFWKSRIKFYGLGSLAIVSVFALMRDMLPVHWSLMDRLGFFAALFLSLLLLFYVIGAIVLYFSAKAQEEDTSIYMYPSQIVLVTPTREIHSYEAGALEMRRDENGIRGYFPALGNAGAFFLPSRILSPEQIATIEKAYGLKSNS